MSLNRFSAVSIAAYFFKKSRADFYEYLADIIEASEGKQTLHKIFASDAQRYGRFTVRGILSDEWLYRISEDGNLAATFKGTVPANDIKLINSLQQTGGGSLTSGFRDLAALVRLDYKIIQIIRNTTLLGVIAILILLAVLSGIPLFTAPSLAESFGDVPTYLYPAMTRRLFHFADWLRDYYLLLFVSVTGGLAFFYWSLSNMHGRFRAFLDRFGVYSLYRDTQAIRFLVMLAIIIQQRGTLNVGVRNAINMLSLNSSPWLRSHLDQMTHRLVNSEVGAQSFNTGLLNRQTYWYLEDLESALGLSTALQKTRTRLESNTLASVALRATVIGWILLLGAIVTLFGIFAWHYAVIFELRGALLLIS